MEHFAGAEDILEQKWGTFWCNVRKHFGNLKGISNLFGVRTHTYLNIKYQHASFLSPLFQAPIAVRMAKESISRGLEVNCDRHTDAFCMFKNSLFITYLLSHLAQVDIGSAMAIERMCYARVRINSWEVNIRTRTRRGDVMGSFFSLRLSWQVIPTRDRQEGMAAFIEKRAPRYTGE